MEESAKQVNVFPEYCSETEADSLRSERKKTIPLSTQYKGWWLKIQLVREVRPVYYRVTKDMVRNEEWDSESK